jgi:hypothetical protein
MVMVMRQAAKPGAWIFAAILKYIHSSGENYNAFPIVNRPQVYRLFDVFTSSFYDRLITGNFEHSFSCPTGFFNYKPNQLFCYRGAQNPIAKPPPIMIQSILKLILQLYTIFLLAFEQDYRFRSLAGQDAKRAGRSSHPALCIVAQ